MFGQPAHTHNHLLILPSLTLSHPSLCVYTGWRSGGQLALCCLGNTPCSHKQQSVSLIYTPLTLLTLCLHTGWGKLRGKVSSTTTSDQLLPTHTAGGKALNAAGGGSINGVSSVTATSGVGAAAAYGVGAADAPSPPDAAAAAADQTSATAYISSSSSSSNAKQWRSGGYGHPPTTRSHGRWVGRCGVVWCSRSDCAVIDTLLTPCVFLRRFPPKPQNPQLQRQRPQRRPAPHPRLPG